MTDAILTEEKPDLKSWLKMIGNLVHAPEWSADDLPIEMRQTHISVLLLGHRHVVKLKKPVDFGFLDYTTLKKRLQACVDEVRLNRRLCPDMYLGIGAVNEIDGRLCFSGGTGKTVDYCVWMKRLPDDQMLDQLIALDRISEAMIDRVANKLSEFHGTANRGPEVAKWGSSGEIRRNWEENLTQTEPFIGRTISRSNYESIRASVNAWLEEYGTLFAQRVHERRIVDGHGDVRCESICLIDDSVYIYDCIDFNDRFRCNDVASEAAFLAMDLDAAGRPDLGYFFAERYERRSSDADFFRLLPFYRCYRAFVRGKVLSFRLNETEFGVEEHRTAAESAANYFELARRYASPLVLPTVIAVAGHSGTGKTSLARAIAGELGLRVVSTDAVRQSLFGERKQAATYGQGAYTPEANRLTYEKLFEEAEARLKIDGGVVLDATFLQVEAREAARKMTQAAGAEWRLIECQLTPELVRRRLAERAARGNGLSDATWEVYLRQREEGASQCTENDDESLALDNSGSLSVIAQRTTDWLRHRQSFAHR